MRPPASLDELNEWCRRAIRYLLVVIVFMGVLHVMAGFLVVPSPAPRPQPVAERQDDGIGPGTILLFLMTGLL